MDNASLVDWDDVGALIAVLQQEIVTYKSSRPKTQFELLFALDGSDDDAAALRGDILEACPSLTSTATLVCHSLADGRYYELKNAGAQMATGEIIIFADSDMAPEPAWLATLLEPFSDPSLQAVNGYTYLDYNDFLSRVLALYWVFPLRDNDDSKWKHRSLNANNCAFRRSWFLQNQFPFHLGFKLSCGMLWKQMVKDGVLFRKVEAYARHAPFQGWRFFVWRALVTGQDEDRRYTMRTSSLRLARSVHAVLTLFKKLKKALRRTKSHGAEVGLSALQKPAAFLVWTTFLVLAFLGQIQHALGFKNKAPEIIPKGIEVS